MTPAFSRRDKGGFKLGFPNVRFAFPGFLDFRVEIRASDEPLKEVRAIRRVELQGFGFQHFEAGLYAELRPT
ncbi:MAG: hypothetical protein H7306_05790 [Bacteriovorax sp.]|nr:hypothetical protein [Rhizobacter sp.]